MSETASIKTYKTVSGKQGQYVHQLETTTIARPLAVHKNHCHIQLTEPILVSLRYSTHTKPFQISKYDKDRLLKMDFRSKSLFYIMHVHFIATKYLWNNALVEYIDNWTQS